MYWLKMWSILLNIYAYGVEQSSSNFITTKSYETSFLTIDSKKPMIKLISNKWDIDF